MDVACGVFTRAVFYLLGKESVCVSECGERRKSKRITREVAHFFSWCVCTYPTISMLTGLVGVVMMGCDGGGV